MRLWAAGFGYLLLSTAVSGQVTRKTPLAVPPNVVEALGVQQALAQLDALARRNESTAAEAVALREHVVEQVLLASFEVDDTLARIDAEAAHAGDSRYVLESQKARRDVELNIATFAVSGALGTAGSAMQLTRGLDHAGNALNVAAGATALTLSIAQLKGGGKNRRVLLSPYNMLAEVLGQTPNTESKYPPLVVAYLHAPTAGDGELPDNVAPEASLRAAWYRLHRLQHDGDTHGASLASVTTDPSQGQKLSSEELADREAMLRDLHGTIALLKSELRTVLLSMQRPAIPAAAR